MGSGADSDSTSKLAADEAYKLLVARMVGSPEAWRARAVALAGLLGALGVASLAGLVLQDGTPNDLAVSLTVGTMSLYVGSFGLYLAGAVSTRRAANRKIADPADFIAELHANSRGEVKRIRKWTIAGAMASGFALVGTMATSTSLLFAGNTTDGRIILEPAARRSLQQACDIEVPGSFVGSITNRPGQPYVTVEIPARSCRQKTAVSVDLSRSLVTMVEDK